MARYLIVANQTLGGDELDRTVRDRVARGDSQFYVLVPLTAPEHETDDWSRGFGLYEGMSTTQIAAAGEAVEQASHRREAAVAEARRRAEHRLDQMLDRIRSAGGQADGAVGDADPATAVKAVLQQQSFDEVVLSTLPAGLSRWIKMDLPSRVARMTTVPVVTVEAQA